MSVVSIETIRPFVEAGFAIHWLRAREKAPISKGWSDAPRATLDQLTRTHHASYNVGVRLGKQSVLCDGTYLHVIDLDIRIPDLADEAWARLHELFPGIDILSLPCVASGSGGESRHLYLVTDKPFFGKKLAVSEGKHRHFDKAKGRDVWSYDWEIELFGTGKQVAMPPSIHPDTGKPYAWERAFDLDSLNIGFGPYISSDLIEQLGAAETATYAFETREPLDFKPGQLEAELELIPLARIDDYHEWVMLGQALHHQFGGSMEGYNLWIKHSKRSAKFEEKGLLRKWRGFGRNRRQPVTMATIRQWVQEARIDALRDAFDEEDEDDQGGCESAGTFEDLLGEPLPAPKPAPATDPIDLLGEAEDESAGESEDEEADEVDPIDLLGSAEAKVDVPSGINGDWIQLLDLSEDKGAIKPTLPNVALIVCNDPRLVGVPQLNEFTQETVQRMPPGRQRKRRSKAPKDALQLEGRIWQVKDTLNGELWSDDRDFDVRRIIEAPTSQGGYGIKVTDRDLKAAVVLAANKNHFHPVREYLEGLTWDGTARVDQLFQRYLAAPDDAYHRTVSRLVLVAAVTRIFEPGHKFDFATILEGLQGKRKSTFIETLGKNWFGELNGDFHDAKSMIELMQGKWIMEIPELTGFSRADVRAIKAFISSRSDRARLAYARRAGEFPRQCIFIGSTNDKEYLKDDTGGRRFWPVECRLPAHQEIDTEHLGASVDQLWAEAVVIYREMRVKQPYGTLPLYITDAEARRTAARLQESRRQENPDDVLAGQIAAWLERPINNGDMDTDVDDEGQAIYRNDTCTAEIWVECFGKDLAAFKTQEQGSINRALAKVPGWGPAGSMRFPRYGKQRRFARGGRDGVIERSGLADLLD